MSKFVIVLEVRCVLRNIRGPFLGDGQSCYKSGVVGSLTPTMARAVEQKQKHGCPGWLLDELVRPACHGPLIDQLMLLTPVNDTVRKTQSPNPTPKRHLTVEEKQHIISLWDEHAEKHTEELVLKHLADGILDRHIPVDQALLKALVHELYTLLITRAAVDVEPIKITSRSKKVQDIQGPEMDTHEARKEKATTTKRADYMTADAFLHWLTQLQDSITGHDSSRNIRQFTRSYTGNEVK
ncbi:hypothetical protein EDD21DRAFT_409378 [Dissophora ornata]|nr:hypothetical protein EDD21DRAFT_409378 [Dissophora ornata]